MIDQPWYPASWLDADGKPLPDVHEVTPGEWPPCKPGDFIEVLMAPERSAKEYSAEANFAHEFAWHWIALDVGDDWYPVAIRIIERAA